MLGLHPNRSIFFQKYSLRGNLTHIIPHIIDHSVNQILSKHTLENGQYQLGRQVKNINKDLHETSQNKIIYNTIRQELLWIPWGQRHDSIIYSVAM